jgi:hypothetical protein
MYGGKISVGSSEIMLIALTRPAWSRRRGGFGSSLLTTSFYFGNVVGDESRLRGLRLKHRRNPSLHQSGSHNVSAGVNASQAEELQELPETIGLRWFGWESVVSLEKRSIETGLENCFVGCVFCNLETTVQC